MADDPKKFEIEFAAKATGDGAEKTAEGIKEVAAQTETATKSLGDYATANQSAASAVEALKVGRLALAVAEKEAQISGDDTAVRELRETVRLVEMAAQLMRQYGVEEQQAIEYARELIALEDRAAAAVAARAQAARDAAAAEQAEVAAQEDLNRALVEEEATRQRIAEAQERARDSKVEEAFQQPAGRDLGGGQSTVYGDFGSGAKKAASGVDELGSALGGLVQRFAGPAAALATLRQSLQFAGEALEEFGQKESAVIALDAALANAGQLTDEYREKLQGLAQALEESTTIADEKWLAVLKRLTQFGADSSNIDQYAEAVKGLAGIMGGDIEGAANLFSRAMTGSFEMFGRYGIRVDSAKSKTEQFQQVLDQLSLRGGAQLEAQAAGLEGKTRALSNAWSQLKENVGNALAPGKKGMLDSLAEGLNWLAGLLPSTVKKVGDLVNRENDLAAAADNAGKALSQETGQIERQSTEIERLIQNTENLKRAKDAEKSREEALAEAQLAKDKAIVDAAEKSGKVTPEQAIVARENLEGRAQDESFQRNKKNLQEEIAENERLLRLLEGKRKMAEGALNSDDDEATRKEKLAEVRKAIDAEDAQRGKNYLENPRLKAEIESQEKLNALKQEARRIGAVADVGETRKKEAEATEKAADKEAAAAEKTRAAAEKKLAAAEKAPATNDRDADRGAAEGLGKSGRGYRDEEGRFHIRRKGYIDGRAKPDPDAISHEGAGANNEAPLRNRPPASPATAPAAAPADSAPASAPAASESTRPSGDTTAGKVQAMSAAVTAEAKKMGAAVDGAKQEIVSALQGLTGKIESLEKQVASLGRV